MKKFLAFLSFSLCLFIAYNFLFKEQLSSKKNLVLNIPVFNQVKTLDPALAFNDDLLKILAQGYETLYQYHYLKRPYEIIPALADGPPLIKNDGKTYEIKIKKGIFYHDQQRIFDSKREVIAEDFINAIKRLSFKPLKSTGSWLFKEKIIGLKQFSQKVGSSLQKMLDHKIEGLYSKDDHTLIINLKAPAPNILYFLSMYFTAPVPKEVLLYFENDLSHVIYGTGPYIYQQNDKNRSNFGENNRISNVLTFVKNDDYRSEFYPSSGDRYANTENLLRSSTKKLPFIKTIKFKVIEDEEDRWNAFLDGDIDILSVPKQYIKKLTEENKEFEKMLNKKGIKVKHFSKLSSRWLSFNMSDPIVGSNLNLRKAIAHAIDIDKYILKLSNNTNLAANSIFNPSIPGYRPSQRMSYRYDLELARDFFKKAQLPKTFVLNYYTRGNASVHLDEAKLIKAQLEKIGLNVKIHVLEFSEFLRLGRANKLQFFTDVWIYDYPDAENIIQLLVSANSPGINKSSYMNKEVDRLYKKMSKAKTRQERYKIMYEVEDIVSRELPWIMMMFESSYILHYDYVKNFRKSYFIKNHFKYLSLE